jgi:hypothetical protein
LLAAGVISQAEFETEILGDLKNKKELQLRESCDSQS